MANKHFQFLRNQVPFIGLSNAETALNDLVLKTGEPAIALYKD